MGGGGSEATFTTIASLSMLCFGSLTSSLVLVACNHFFRIATSDMFVFEHKHGERILLSILLNFTHGCFFEGDCEPKMVPTAVLSGSSLDMYICIHVRDKGIYSRGI